MRPAESRRREDADRVSPTACVCSPVYSHARDPSGTCSPPQVHIQPVFNQNDEVDQFMAMLHEVDEKERPPHAAPAAAKKAGRRGERA